ncbi:DUF2383 domain-containing protein [Limibacter armeniacum]|uniref:DUF2383 domain-containing protein n=1 Tax=Limibacter armeniacum TaxID=466084 RepID=UPI002FE6BCE1
MEDQTTARALRKMAGACNNSAAMYKDISKLTSSATVQEVTSKWAEECQEMRNRINELIRDHGGVPVHLEDIDNILERMWLKYSDMLKDRTDETFIDICSEMERDNFETFKQVMDAHKDISSNTIIKSLFNMISVRLGKLFDLKRHESGIPSD